MCLASQSRMPSEAFVIVMLDTCSWWLRLGTFVIVMLDIYNWWLWLRGIRDCDAGPRLYASWFRISMRTVVGATLDTWLQGTVYGRI